MPDVRGLSLDDPATWSKRTQYQFMSGASLLVAPVYEDTIVRNDIYLPAGKWIDYWDGAEFNGSTTLNGYAAPLEKLPMFVRAGAIIPMYPEMLYDGEKPRDPVTLDLYPFGASRFDLYEDDGVTQGYRKGEFARTVIDMQAPTSLGAPGETVTVKVGAARGQYAGMPASRAYVLDLHTPAKPARVAIGGRELPMFDVTTGDRATRDKARAAFNAATEGWMFDAADRRGVLRVKVPPQRLATGFTAVITQ
jgi:hypothetical protein